MFLFDHVNDKYIGIHQWYLHMKKHTSCWWQQIRAVFHVDVFFVCFCHCSFKIFLSNYLVFPRVFLDFSHLYWNSQWFSLKHLLWFQMRARTDLALSTGNWKLHVYVCVYILDTFEIWCNCFCFNFLSFLFLHTFLLNIVVSIFTAFIMENFLYTDI